MSEVDWLASLKLKIKIIPDTLVTAITKLNSPSSSDPSAPIIPPPQAPTTNLNPPIAPVTDPSTTPAALDPSTTPTALPTLPPSSNSSTTNVNPTPVAPKPTKPLSLLFIGETGAGKTTLINSLYFYAQDKPLSQLEALVRTKYLSGKTAGSESNSHQNQSQTTRADVHCFTLETPDMKYEVKVMDTPGIGDTRGLAQDDKNITEIVSTVEKTPELNAVFLILNGSQSRLTSHVAYVVQKLKGMLPNVFRDNLFLILTNSSIKANLVLEKETLNVDDERQFAIDNSIFAMDFSKTTDYQKTLLENSWDQLKRNIVFILNKAAALKGVRTDAFQVIREKRDLLQLKISVLQKMTSDLAREKSELQDLEAKIHTLTAGSATLKQIQANSSREQKEVRFEDTPYHNTICRQCDYVHHNLPQCCHERCSLNFSSIVGDNIFKSCVAVSVSTVITRCLSTKKDNQREMYPK